MATYFELANYVLSELKLSTVTDFSQLTTRLHLQILDKLNKINQDVLIGNLIECRKRSADFFGQCGVFWGANQDVIDLVRSM